LKTYWNTVLVCLPKARRAAYQGGLSLDWLPTRLKGGVMLRWLGNVLLCACIAVAAAGLWAYGEHASAVVYVVAGIIILIGFVARFFFADSGSEK
jgi:hypothetical protein